MAVDITGALLAAQNATLRSPLIELKSIQTASSIPFLGDPFNFKTEDEAFSTLLAHSTGVLIFVWVRDNYLILNSSDTDHINWTETTLFSIGNANNNITSLDITELSDGNIGLVYTKRDSLLDTSYIIYSIITPAGGVVQAASTIASYGTDYALIGASVACLNNGTYYLTYSLRYLTDYGVYRRISSDFMSWGSETEITTGFTDTYKHYETRIKQATTDNDVLLYVSYANETRDAIVEKVNIYELVSTDYGVTWGAATKLTDVDIWGEGAFEAAVAENSANQLLLTYVDKTAVLAMDSNTDLWQQECGSYAIGARIHYDEDRKYLYSVNIYTYVGGKILCSVVVIDVDNWVVHRSYTTTTTPAYPTIFKDNLTMAVRATDKSDGQYTTVSSRGGTSGFHTMVINDEAETIKHYVWLDSLGYTRNINGLDFRGYDSYAVFPVCATAVVASEGRLYVALGRDATFGARILLGYIDLTEAPVGGFYTWTEIAWIEDWAKVQVFELSNGSGRLQVIPDEDMFIVSTETTVDTWTGRTETYKISTGASIKKYAYDVDIGYPFRGVTDIIYHAGYIYGYFPYHTGHGQENYRGMARIDTQTDAVSYLQPSYITVDDYTLRAKIATSEGLLIIAAETYGVITYDIDTGLWRQYNPATEPELYLGYDNAIDTSVAYNESDGVIYAGCPGTPFYDTFAGIRAFTEGGALRRIKYRMAEKSGSWSYGEEFSLVTGNYERYPYPAYLADDTLWLVWQKTNNTSLEKSIYYANNIAELDLTPYLTESAITINKSIKSPGKMSFTVSKGHLFDQNNSGSTLTRFLKKGRALTLRFGERVDGVDYWSAQGTFYVDTFKMSYERGKYPSARIGCVDRIALLKWAHTVASAHFDGQYPEPVIESLLINHTNLTAQDINIDSFTARHIINYQVVDEKLLKALEEILNHFGVYLYASVDNIIEARPVRFSGTINNTYSDNTKVESFTPDDNFSDYTNKITVMGEGLNPIEVLYDEELLAPYSGSGGWWESGSEERDIYYSSDKKRKARNARLVVLKSIKDFEILFMESGGDEYFLSEDPNGFFCTIVIEFPGLAAVLIGLIASVIALGIAAVWCDSGGFCGSMLLAFSVLVSAVSYLLGQVANYDYEIHGRPFGEELQQYQASANDLELQNFIDGLIIDQSFDDPFCYTQAECQRVADYEMQVVQSQRRRISFSKIANIQDEPGDILRIKHPYSGTILDVFVTDISRSYKRGTVRKKNGHFIDKINGWRI